MMTIQQLEQSSTSNARDTWPGTGESNGVHRGPWTEDPHAKLVEDLKLRRPEAYDLLFSTYRQRLLRVAFRITMCNEDAEDVVQNTFLQVFNNVERFRGDSQFSSWITAIAINQALMTLRRRKAMTISLDAGVEMAEHHVFLQLTNCECTPEQAYLRRELEEILLGFAKRLKKTNRSLFEMRFAEELSLDEIAQRLGITVSATKSRLCRARQDMRSRAKKNSQLKQLRGVLRTGFPGTEGHHVRLKLSDHVDTNLTTDWHSIAS